MINVNYEGTIYPIKNLLQEFKIKEFEQICSILNNKEKQHFQKWSEIFIYLGIPVDVVDDFDAIAFISIIKQFNLKTTVKNTIIKEIELGGIIYQAFDENFKLTVKDTATIENFITKDNEFYIAELLAVVYKRTDTTKTINYDAAHLKYKADLIRKEITADIAIPLINFFNKKLINDFDIIENNGQV